MWDNFLSHFISTKTRIHSKKGCAKWNLRVPNLDSSECRSDKLSAMGWWPFDGEHKNPRKMARARSTQLWIILGVFVLCLCVQQLNADDREITGTFLSTLFCKPQELANNKHSFIYFNTFTINIQRLHSSS